MGTLISWSGARSSRLRNREQRFHGMPRAVHEVSGTCDGLLGLERLVLLLPPGSSTSYVSTGHRIARANPRPEQASGRRPRSSRGAASPSLPPARPIPYFSTAHRLAPYATSVPHIA
eukprot:3940643-Rhodomonas_salina.7